MLMCEFGDRPAGYIFDPPGPGSLGGHYFHAWCPYMRVNNKNKLQR